ncbi:MAG: hypothetical protein NZO16_05675 [Deltaproteobacteria bacterium]|nr:hypothetical protein [Deltaproteobacteria bacterium]
MVSVRNRFFKRSKRRLGTPVAQRRPNTGIIRLFEATNWLAGEKAARDFKNLAEEGNTEIVNSDRESIKPK